MNDDGNIQTLIDEQFQKDTKTLAENTGNFISRFYPSYIATDKDIPALTQKNSLRLLNSFTFYKLCSCLIPDVSNKFEFFAERIEKLFVTAYAIKQTVC